MNDNYLWDRTGEPDPEIQELEEILGTLRYQPRPLEIPADLRIARRRNFFPVAIAAAIAFFVIGAGLWFQFSRSQWSAIQANNGSRIETQTVPTPPIAPPNQVVDSGGTPQMTPPRPQPKRMLIAANKHRETRVKSGAPALTPQELADKEQVLVALRLVSAKLNLAQRKVQGLPQRNIYRNQNKIG
jgi:hypothetical protein